MRFLTTTLAVIVTVTAASANADAADYYLTIGGGYHPEGNQVSLEKNVLLFRRTLDEFYPEGVSQSVYFADGDDPHRDLQYVDPDFEVPRAQKLLARLFGKTDDIANLYRNHQIENLDGPASRQALDEWFEKVGSTLGAEDRLFIYSTAHGGRSSDKDHPFDTTLYLWNRERLQVHDFTKLLDTVPDEVPVVMVMVQCFSGGFAHSIFNDGKPDEGLSRANRCGFFATVEDRVAAGCTPDIDEANYREYSTYFFQALRGRTRFDEPLVKPDYDGDGRISFAEAHAYTILTSTTIDIPVRTSDAFLRQYSRTKPEGGTDSDDAGSSPSESGEPVATAADDDDETTAGSPAEQDAPEQASDSEETVWLTADSDYDTLIADADVIDRTIIDGLSDELQLTGANRASDAREHAKSVQQRRNRLNRERGRTSREFNQVREGIRRKVLAEWPELNNPFHPVTTQVLTGQADQLVELVESDSRFQRMEELAAKLEEIDRQQRDDDREWVKCQRLLRTLESVALAGNLPQVATPEIVERYTRLRAAESGVFGP